MNEVQSKTVSNYKRHTDTQSLGEEEFLLHYSAEGETAFRREHFNLQLIFNDSHMTKPHIVRRNNGQTG